MLGPSIGPGPAAGSPGHKIEVAREVSSEFSRLFSNREEYRENALDEKGCEEGRKEGLRAVDDVARVVPFARAVMS